MTDYDLGAVLCADLTDQQLVDEWFPGWSTELLAQDPALADAPTQVLDAPTQVLDAVARLARQQRSPWTP